MEQFQDFLNKYLPGNNWLNFLGFLGILTIGTLFRRVIGKKISQLIFGIVRSFSRENEVTVQEFVALLGRPLEYVFWLIMAFFAFDLVHIPSQWELAHPTEFGLRLIFLRGYKSLLILALTWALVRFVKFLAIVFTRRSERTESKMDDQLVPFVKDLLIVFIVIVSGLIITGKVFNIDVATLITGLGIGGIAIALAARETLENLLASFTIFVDGSFVVGDAIQIGTMTGDVEKIGFRSTRIRTVDGSLVTVPNRLIVSQVLENLTQREFRRAKYTIRLDVGTTSEQLSEVIKDIQDVIDVHEFTKNKPGVIRFDAFGDQSFDVLVIYFVETRDIRTFNRIKEEVNFKIMQIVLTHGVRFASPISTVHLKNDFTNYSGGNSL